MTLDDLKASFASSGILLVQVEYLEDPEYSQSLQIVGDLTSYTVAIKTLAISVVFVYTETLVAEDFEYWPNADDDDDDDDEGEARDLCVIDSDLRRLKQHIGEAGSFTLYATMAPKGIGYLIVNDWYADFIDRQSAAIDSIDEHIADEQDEIAAQERERFSAVAAQLEALSGDKQFIKLPTQKAMTAYAKLKVPGVDEMAPGDLREAISDLRARIIAKGLK